MSEDDVLFGYRLRVLDYASLPGSALTGSWFGAPGSPGGA
jgi:hypothetical protein